MPAEAVGRITRTAVCHGEAPRASDAAFRCSGTLESASSEIVKMIGITAKPIANAMTRELRASYFRDAEARSQALKSPAKTILSTQGPANAANPVARTASGRTRTKLLPGVQALAHVERKHLEGEDAEHREERNHRDHEEGRERRLLEKGREPEPGEEPEDDGRERRHDLDDGLDEALDARRREDARVERRGERDRDREQHRVERPLERPEDERYEGELGLEVVRAAARLPDVLGLVVAFVEDLSEERADRDLRVRRFQGEVFDALRRDGDVSVGLRRDADRRDRAGRARLHESARVRPEARDEAAPGVTGHERLAARGPRDRRDGRALRLELLDGVERSGLRGGIGPHAQEARDAALRVAGDERLAAEQRLESRDRAPANRRARRRDGRTRRLRVLERES